LKPGDPIAGDYRRVSTIDGVDYLISYRKVRSHPLVIYVLQPVTTVLTPYYEQRKNYLIFGSLATALLFALTYLLISRLIAQQIDAQNKARLAAVVESANDAIITRGTSGRIVTWNAAAERLYGYTAAEAIGRKDFLTPSELQEQVIQFRKMVKAGKVVPPTESVRVARDGRRIDVMISVSPILGQDGRFVGSATITHDITERKRAEAALSKLNEELESRVKDRTADLEAANKELEAFSYSVSHDLRAPLRSILGFGNFLMAENAEQLNAEGKTRLHRILNAGKRMEALIDDLLNLSRVSRQEIRRQEVDLSALAGGVVADLIQRHPEREVQAKVQPEMRVNADAGLLRIVLENLIGNAWKFTAKTDNACIEVGLDIRDGKSIYYIRDNGAGFDMTYAHKLFAPFQRLHSRDEFEGSGIGLSIVNRIVAKHGGRVWVESEKGKGATFYFTC
jgi:PAS domain S-box-containing protein